MKNRRRKLLIDRRVQRALTRRVMFHWFVLVLATTCALPLFRAILLGEVGKPLAVWGRELLADGMILLIVFASLAPYFILDTLKISNRFVGPMYRIHSGIRSIAEKGHAAPIKLRKGDFWHEVADDFNRMLTRVASQDGDQAAKSEPGSVPSEAEAQTV